MRMDGRFRFDNFVVGSANRLAVSAAHAVAEAPGTTYNPLFIYSGSGLGKTHLIGAIAQHARGVQPAIAIEYVTLDEFVEALHAAISTGHVDPFKARYQHVDLLLIDDVQFLTGRRETQSELLRLFNALQSAGRQIVLTSDRPPNEIADVDERLLTRLAGGLIVDIGVPDYETRVAILRNRCEERQVRFPPGVIEELAQVGFTNVRELQGALNRLIAHQGLDGGEITPDDVRELVGAPASASHPLVASAEQPRIPGASEYQSFLSDLAQTVAQHVEGWKTRIGEAIAHWSGEGYRVSVLERALALPRPPDVDGLLSTYEAAVDHLRDLEAQATAIDPALGGTDVFRDPERVGEAEELVDRALAGQTAPPGPSAAFARNSYETSASNQFAVRAADAVVEEPGARYNPLFVHGTSGTGKTHLVNAIGNELLNVSGGAMTVSVVGAQTFIDELIAALQEGTVERWRARYRSADALVIDDVHFVAGKERTQEELFHLFNTMHADGKQVVLASDRAPSEITGLEDRLRSRFEGGLVVAVQPPDRMLRRKLYARFLAAVDGGDDPAVLAYLEDRPAGSVRELIGIASRLAAAADLAGVPLSSELARRELEGTGAGSAPAPAPDSVAKSADPFFLDDEKVVWDWPDVGGRIIEDLR